MYVVDAVDSADDAVDVDVAGIIAVGAIVTRVDADTGAVDDANNCDTANVADAARVVDPGRC